MDKFNKVIPSDVAIGKTYVWICGSIRMEVEIVTKVNKIFFNAKVLKNIGPTDILSIKLGNMICVPVGELYKAE